MTKENEKKTIKINSNKNKHTSRKDKATKREH